MLTRQLGILDSRLFSDCTSGSNSLRLYNVVLQMRPVKCDVAGGPADAWCVATFCRNWDHGEAFLPACWLHCHLQKLLLLDVLLRLSL